MQPHKNLLLIAPLGAVQTKDIIVGGLAPSRYAAIQVAHMRRGLLILILGAILSPSSVDAQYVKKEYPISVYYVKNGIVNLKVGVNRISDFEGASFLFVELPSLSFAGFQNPHKESELVYSQNPLLWCINTAVFALGSDSSGWNVAEFFYTFTERFINTKFHVRILSNAYITFGLDHDYLLSRSGGLGFRGEFSFGLKYSVGNCSTRLLYDMESIDFSRLYRGVSRNSFRIDFSFAPQDDPVSQYIYYCGSRERIREGW